MPSLQDLYGTTLCFLVPRVSCCYNFIMSDEELLLLSILADQLKSSPSFQETVSLESLRLRQGKIRRRALLPPSQSPLSHLFNSGQDDALVTLCGFDHRTFSTLHDKFKVDFDKYSPYCRRGGIR
jgi:hypothetical protein